MSFGENIPSLPEPFQLTINPIGIGILFRGFSLCTHYSSWNPFSHNDLPGILIPFLPPRTILVSLYATFVVFSHLLCIRQPHRRAVMSLSNDGL
jgi:hypothetical protein